ncbi:alpha/beta hydrolase [Nocardioides sp. zg-536]|uniref:Alpha/beta hydrolase n=1 Tax=Nocardioides faecalis TaxID=2803858 RepID=A0A938Y377_9ACTN|nr:alpha/beta hydrolase family protein [Nocardioides faecalis]MBM9459168.1 alpha/beta hydrolase [Nocardioides faecalis]MBS4751416.1 alpha/beta hydrolase [Nocardioides faecalis]QVI59690.1 alpha/beta hydrolase [Nocardioides faecalis]
MTTFVLVHGAFRGGWAWRRVRPLLLAAGHDVHAPSLLGSGEHAAHLGAVSGLQVWVDQVSRLLELEDLYDVVLVGHSQGGLVTTGVAAAVPERIGLLVHLDAALPLPGQRAVDLLGAPAALPARETHVPPQPAAAAGEHDPATAAWLDARTTASPVAVALDPVVAVPPQVREMHAFCSQTPEGYPSRAVRARLDAAGTSYRLLVAGHDAPLSAPELVAELLLDAAAENDERNDG